MKINLYDYEKLPDRTSELVRQLLFIVPADESVNEIFVLLRKAVEKCFFVFGTLSLMEDGCWPEGTKWIDDQIAADTPLDKPSQKILDRIDYEKIDGLEAVYDSYKILEGIRERLEPKVFLRLEHYVLEIKMVCLALRGVADVYFSLRGLRQKSLDIPMHVMELKYKVLYKIVREYPCVLMDFEKKSGKPLGKLLSEMQAEMG